MKAFEIEEQLARRAAQGTASLEFLHEPAIRALVYVLPAGAVDPQQPHAEDEIYHVVRGRARIQVGVEDRAVGPGSIVYVPARVEHRFHSIAETLEVLAVFAPGRGGR
jgi:mannose-6-phosphate isomerase-like protein (cupin superfamily)